jgi:hypothetical protein
MVPETPKPPGTAAPTQLIDMKIPRLGAVHPAASCAWCGATDDFVRTVLRHTLAEAVVCSDPVGCARRRRMAA